MGARVGHAQSEEEEEEEEEEEDDREKKPLKKRIINGVDEDDEDEEEEEGCDKHGGYDDEGRAQKVGSKAVDSVPGTPSDPPSGIPLPDNKSLELILDKLQKKDIYGVYAEPVDPEELPDYHDVIEHPMDFATLRKKLGNGSYSTLEQFESDVFLICSNAMQYNAPETIYHKQARSIQELAGKKFKKLRIDIERSEKELKSEQKTKSNSLVKKQTKKPLSRTPQEPVGSDFSSGATLATAGDVHNGSNPTQAADCERPNNTDALVEGNASFIDTNLEKAEELLSGKGLLSKFGRKSFVLDENRRATYSISNQPVIRSESICTTFEGEIKQLVAVGLHAEFSYARSLARFAATLGPVAWKVASQRIEQALPAGCKFGRGWVGEYEPLPTPVLMLENHSQKEYALFAKLPSVADVRNNDKSLKSSVPGKEHLVNGPTSEQKLLTFGSSHGPALEGQPSFFASAGKKASAPRNATYQQQNLPSRNFAQRENKVSMQVELNSLPSANLKNANLVAENQLSSNSNSEMVGSRSREMASRNMICLQSVPFRQSDTNGVVAAGLLNGEVTSNSMDSKRMVTPSSDGIPDQIARAATYPPHGQEQGLSDTVQLMKILSERAQRQQKSSNQSAVETPPVTPSIPSVKRDDSRNAAAAAARAWMSIGAGAFKQATEASNKHKNQISVDSPYNPSRELNPQMSQVQGQFPLSGGVPFQSEKNNFPLEAFVPQVVHGGSELQFQNRPLFPQVMAADLSRFHVQSTWRGISPHAQPRQKQETLPPDLNIGFQAPGSPVKQSSGVLVDSQQPDLALQL